MSNFRKQIIEDIELIQENYGHLDSNLKKQEYAFNFWVLSNIFSMEEEIIREYITEYNDKSIDCYAHFEESKELFIIQNKFYNESTPLKRNDIADFLETPLAVLREGHYKNKDLQNIFNDASKSTDYKIRLFFFVSNNKQNETINLLFKDFNKKNHPNEAEIIADILYLGDIEDRYYGKQFKNNIDFDFILETRNKGTILRILPEDYNLPNMSKAYYITTPVNLIYKMYKSSLEKNYPLFEENIREYLGPKSINAGIIKTLKSDDRSNFFYYNNGITIICNEAQKVKRTGDNYSLNLVQPQVVNGCQTVNTIYEVLSSYNEEDIRNEFNDVYVMAKVLVTDKKNSKFYKDVVKFTNTQNSIKEKDFAATSKMFLSIQDQFKKRGFLLIIKQSDKYTFKKDYKHSSEELDKMLSKAKNFIRDIDINIPFKKTNDIYIPLDRLLQVFLSVVKNGYYAYTKKSIILKPDTNSKIFEEYSSQIDKYLSIENMIRLFLIFKKAEFNRKKSEDKKTPIPYYLTGFMGHFIDKEKRKFEKLNSVLKKLFSSGNEYFQSVYNYFSKLTTLYKKNYKKNHNIEYNAMIKKEIDNKLLLERIGDLNDILDRKETIFDFIEFLEK